MTREVEREVTKAYHGTGKMQLSRGFEHLRKNTSDLPAFTDKTFAEMREAVKDLTIVKKNEEDETPIKNVDKALRVKARIIAHQAKWMIDNNK